MANDVKVIDDSGWRAFVRTASTLGNISLDVGFVGPHASEMHGDSGLTNAEIGMINEYGTRNGHVPERAPLKTTFEQHRGEVAKVLARAVERAIQNNNPEAELSSFGEWAAGEVRWTIKQGLSPANAASTIARKGSSIPVIDTEELAKSVTYKIDHTPVSSGEKGPDE